MQLWAKWLRLSHYSISIWAYLTCLVAFVYEHIFFLFLNSAFTPLRALLCHLHLNLDVMHWLDSAHKHSYQFGIPIALLQAQDDGATERMKWYFHYASLYPMVWAKVRSITWICCSSARILSVVFRSRIIARIFLGT